jgi:hypothetical protein
VNQRIHLSKAQRARLDQERQLVELSDLLDQAFRVPGLGVRFGFDALIGLIPGLGDTLTSFASLYILGVAAKMGVPRVTIARMGLNLGIDYVIGSLPLLGDAFDVWWKSNVRNVDLVRRHLSSAQGEARQATRADWLFVGLIMAVLLAILAASAVLFVSLAAWLVRQVGGLFYASTRSP